MTMIDKVIGAMTPLESDEQRQQARAHARASAGRGWLSLILDHHEQIEQAFADVAAARSATGRRHAAKELGLVLTGHSIAEESVIYPALAKLGDKSASQEAYKEQSEAKTQMALFSHGQFGRVLAVRWIGLSARAGEGLALDPASISTLGFEEDDPSRPVISLWNATPSALGGIRPSSSTPC